MAKIVELQVKLSSQSGQQHMGAFCWKEFNTSDRLKRAGSAAVICLAIGAATLLIPIVHFVVPAVLVVLAPIIAILRYRTATLPFLVAGKCPNCNRPIRIELDSHDKKPPLHKYCPSCDQPVRILITGS